ncbi:acyltransferase family protein [Tropicimonas sp. IMCC6043]|uniref:acyltransferase family protein n=1 Tax=Tropicimonas sp. IMCC6043 TaxID=2510645 RepID=UPI00101DFE7D|nr:acyltransferase family protein [Tropicimonas sp. IMCC6043]RYH06682.1 acyltransferase [Tropicimonas sp. IMCC6043]
MKYRAEIDGLRAVAVLPVILFHAGVAGFGGGFVGVDVFFVISGFLITGILLDDLDRGRYSLLTFYERRARRILPALGFVVLACLPAAWAILLPPDLESFGKSVVAVATFWSNVLFWRESDYFATAAELKPLLHTWSLAVEEQFYILFPLLLAVLFRHARRWIVAIFAAALLVSLAGADFGARVKPVATFYLLPTRGWELLLGALVALRMRRAPELLLASLDNLLSGAGLLAILAAVVLFDSTTPFPGRHAFLPALGTAAILFWAGQGTLVGRLLATRPLVFIGLISYSAYLWHQPFIAFFRYRLPEQEAFVPLVALLSLPVAWASWKYVETPVRFGAAWRRRELVFGSALALLISLTGAGLLLMRDGGLPGRFDPAEARLFAAFAGGPDYVPVRFNQLRGRAFAPRDGRTRVLLIGDSYGEDLVNALVEAGHDAHLNLSTFHISRRCGNLFIDDLAGFREPGARKLCARRNGYDNPELRTRMRQADETWLVSSWQPWSAPLLPESIANLRQLTDRPIIVFGRKHFGERSLRFYHAGGTAALLTRRAVPDDLAAVQRDMAQSIPALVPYVDLQMLVCGDYYSCANDDGTGAPISFDGTHLTPEGASFVGRRLDDFMARYASGNPGGPD